VINENSDSPFWIHVEELRKTFIHVLLIVALGSLFSFFFYKEIISILKIPLQGKNEITHEGNTFTKETLIRERIFNKSSRIAAYPLGPLTEITAYSEGVNLSSKIPILSQGAFIEIEKPHSQGNLIILSPIEGFTSTIKLCFWVGIVSTAPFWIFCLMNFISPALKAKERKLIIPFIFFSILFLGAGFLAAFFITIPLANQYLVTFNESIGTNFWSFSSYLDYTIFLLLANGLVFELGVLLLFLVHYRVLTVAMLTKKRRIMILCSFVLGAILTPPDVLTQVLLAIPIMVLYECAIFYARFLNKQAAITVR
jgi:sec-independent protein translocase protein TatC